MKTTRNGLGFHVGDRVAVAFGQRKMTGTIVEDRGPIGVRGRRLFQIEVPRDPDDPMLLEYPEDEMEVAETYSSVPTDKKKIVEYLVNGGLIGLLLANLSGGKNQPRGWLCLNSLGHVTHSYDSRSGGIGGQTIPFLAVHSGKIFTPHRQAVVSFVESFGLSRQEAERVVSEVGTAP